MKNKIKVENRKNDINLTIIVVDENKKPIEDIYISKNKEIKKVSFFTVVQTFLPEKKIEVEFNLIQKLKKGFNVFKIETFYMKDGTFKFNNDNYTQKRINNHPDEGITIIETSILENSYNFMLEEGAYEMTAVFVEENKSKKVLAIAPFFVIKK